jgi:MerR family transcriptional regulator/heat shock protein HspR
MDREPRRTARDAGAEDRGVYIISVAAELVGVHPQTLRIYERKGLLSPSRTSGNSRRYSQSDIRRLKTIQQLTQEGVNLAGVQMVLDMESRLEEMRELMREMRSEMESVRKRAVREVERTRREQRAEIVPLTEVRRLTFPVRAARAKAPGPRRGPFAVGPGDAATTTRTEPRVR